jgi:hypothetical protein
VNPNDFGHGTIPAGFRGEYQNTLQKQARLYLSGVDHKLHLLDAEAGVWNIDDRSEIRYARLGEGETIDEWRYLEGGRLSRQLNAAGGFLIYAGESEILLKKAHLEPALLTALPPQSHSDWLALGSDLESFKGSFEPADFKGMYAQFEGPECAIQGATLHNFHVTRDGFRFALGLQAGFRASPECGLDLSSLTPGRYVIQYERGEFKVNAFSPARLEITTGSVRFSPNSLVAMEPVQIFAEMRNTGTEDALKWTVYAIQTDAPAPEVVDVYNGERLSGGEKSQVDFTGPRRPPASGGSSPPGKASCDREVRPGTSGSTGQPAGRGAAGAQPGRHLANQQPEQARRLDRDACRSGTGGRCPGRFISPGKVKIEGRTQEFPE